MTSLNNQPVRCAYEHCPNNLPDAVMQRRGKFCSKRCKDLEHQQRRRRLATKARQDSLAMPFPGPGETLISGQVIKLADLVANPQINRIMQETYDEGFAAGQADQLADGDEPPRAHQPDAEWDPEAPMVTGASGDAWQDRISHA